MSGVEVAYAVAAAGLAIAATSLLAPKGPTTEIGKLEDRGIQSSAYGEPINRFYGTITAPGNVIWLKGGKLDEHVKKKKQGGKGGGGGTTTKTYTYSGTFILGLGGPIAGVRRIWCLDKLIYNAGSDDLETIIASNQAANAWAIYTGTDDQMPDPDYEADVGVGNAPALRGMSYIKFKDFQLADYNNSLQGAQFKVEVVQGQQISAVLSYLHADENLSTQNGLLFRDAPGEIVRTWPYAGGETPKIIRVHRTHGPQDEALYFDGPSTIDVSANIATGDIKYAFIKRPGTIYTSAGEFSGFSWNLSTSGFRVHYKNETLGVMWTSGPGASEIHLRSTQNYSNATRSYYAMTLSDDRVYAITSTEIVTFDYELNEISSVEHDSLYSLAFERTYISFDAGLIWVLPSNNLIIQAFDPATGIRVFSLESPVFEPDFFGTNGQAGIYKDGIVYRRSGEAGSAKIQAIHIASIFGEQARLADIIAAEISRSSLVSLSDIDVLQIAEDVVGYRVSGGTIRAALEQPQGAYPFDVIQSGYKIKCVPRGQTSVVTIPWEHLGANDSDEAGDLITQSREMDSQLPAITAVSYLSSEREYATGEQIAQRINTAAVNRTDLELAMVLTDDKAAQVAEVLQGIAWLERTDFSITLPPIYLPLEPSDVVTVSSKNAIYELRLTEVNYTPDGRLECKAKPNRAALYISSATGGTGITPPSTIGLSGESLIVELDIPLVDEVSQNAVGFVTAATCYTNGWPGAVLVRSADDGQTWEDLQAYTGMGGIGYATGVLPASPGHLIDQRSLAVSFISGEPESITLGQLLTGYNYAAYGFDGRWEIVRFQSATLNADTSYTLSGFVRGDKGTEWATGLHVAGDYFILLDDPDNAFIGTAVQTIGLARDYRAVTSGASVDDAENTVFTYNGVNLECLSPVNARATRDGSGNLSATFTRRSRLGSSWWGTGVEAPVGETTQAYEIDVMSGATVKRTITSTTPAFSYSAADQTTDFGSAQASITFRIYQLSEIVGRGYVREVTL
ncbi:MAG: hypothetical protein CMK71_02475 [Pseudomonadaceae bacterium]|nr:hypothetical protein [Pseudomonadaceae bacterium]